jgi:Type IV secretion system pilin
MFLMLLQHVAAATSCKSTFLGFVPWNYYLDVDAAHGCVVTTFNLLGGNSGLILIALAILDDIFRAAGLLAVVYVIYAGAKYILSNGSPDEAAKARGVVINALVGLAIAAVAIPTVSFLGAQAGTTNATTMGSVDVSSLPNPGNVASGGFVQTGLSITFGLLGAISFIIIVIAGLQYVLSQGDASTINRSKSTIVYALVGLVLAIVAQSIVSFVWSKLPS